MLDIQVKIEYRLEFKLKCKRLFQYTYYIKYMSPAPKNVKSKQLSLFAFVQNNVNLFDIIILLREDMIAIFIIESALLSILQECTFDSAPRFCLLPFFAGALVQWLKLPDLKVVDHGLEPHSGL